MKQHITVNYSNPVSSTNSFFQSQIIVGSVVEMTQISPIRPSQPYL